MKERAATSDLKALQRQMAGMVFRPLTASWKMQKKTEEGGSVAELAESFIKPNDRLTSFERLEIYNRCYWFRVLDSLYEDFPGLHSLLGNRKFLKLITEYLIRYPSESFTLRNLGSRLESFLMDEPHLAAPQTEMALDMLRFEWAQILAFDNSAKKPISPRQIQAKSPARLRLGLQPYLSLLELDHAVDHYLIAVKNQEGDGLRNEASNTPDSAPEQGARAKRLRLPKREKVWLAVHRYDNQLYFKRLDPAAFALLQELKNGETLEAACASALGIDLANGISEENFPLRLTDWFADWASLDWLIPYSSKKQSP